MAKQGDYYDEVLKRLIRSSRELEALLETPPERRPANAAEKVRALRREMLELTDEKGRTERGLRRRDIDLTSDDRPARRAKAKPSTGKTEAKPRTTGKVEARTGKTEAPTGKVEARTGKVEARPRATGKMEAPTGKVAATATRGAGKLRRAAGKALGKVSGPLAALDLALAAGNMTEDAAETTSRGWPAPMLPGGIPMSGSGAPRRRTKKPVSSPEPPTTQPLVEKAMKYYPTALAQAAATAGHGSYQEIQRRYQPMMSNIMADVRSRVTPMMSDDEVRGMLQRGVDDFVGRLDGLKPAGGVYRPGVGGPVPGSGMR